MKLIDKLKTAAKIGTGVVAGSGAFLYSSNDEPAKNIADDAFFKGDTVSVTESVKPEDKFSSIDKYFSGRVALGDEFHDLIRKGDNLQKKHEYEKSIEYNKKASTLNPEHPSTYVNLCSIYSMWAESIQKEDSNKASNLYELSNKFAQTALEKLNKNTLGINQNDVFALTSIVYENLGFSSKLNGNKDDAIKSFKLSLKYRHTDLVEKTLNDLSRINK